MGEVRRLARAQPPPPRGGWVGLVVDAVRDGPCITDGGEQAPPWRGAQRRAVISRRLGRRLGAWGRRACLGVLGCLRWFGGCTG